MRKGFLLDDDFVLTFLLLYESENNERFQVKKHDIL